MIFDDDEEDFSFEDTPEPEESSETEPLSDENLPLENADYFQQSDTWRCSCGQENVGDFCIACGKPKNQEPALPANDTWRCSCGQENVGDFCIACGKPKNQNSKNNLRQNLEDLADNINNQRRRSAQSDSEPPPQQNSVNVSPRAENLNERPNPPQPQQNYSPQSQPLPTPPHEPPSTTLVSPETSNDSNKKIIIGAIVGAILFGGGFFSYQHFKETPDNITNTVPAVQENMRVISTWYVVNCNTSVTLRSTPSVNAQELAQVPLGQAVGFIENTDNGFCKVNFDGTTGYILAQYLSVQKPAMTQKPAVDQSAPANNTASALSLGGVKLGDSFEKFQNVLGRADRIKDSQFEYKDIIVFYNGRHVIGLVSYSPAVKTEQNIREGSTLNEIKAAYGIRCSVQNFEDLTLYEYPYDTGQGTLAVMRFAMKNGVVNYISLRYVSDPKEKNEILSSLKTI